MEQRKQETKESQAQQAQIDSDFCRRFLTCEVRSDDADGNVITGTATTFNDYYPIGGWFLEKIEPGAPDGADFVDTKCLLNHDANILLGATSSKTLSIVTTPTGMDYRSILPNTTSARDAFELVKGGLINKSSFGFTVSESRWETVERKSLDGTVDGGILDQLSYKGMVDIRVITKFKKIYDVSPVTYPANPNTSSQADKRAWQEYRSALGQPSREEETKPVDMTDTYKKLSRALELKAAIYQQKH